MVVGTYSFAGKKTAAPMRGFEPIPRGIYTMQLNTLSAEIRKKDEPGKAARVAVKLLVPELTDEAGKPRMIFHDFNLSLKKGKDGTVMPERADGLLGLSIALGEDPGDLPIVQQSDVGGKSFPQLSAKAALQWLKTLNGREIVVEVDVEPKRGEYAAKNRIISFASLDGAAEQSAEESSEETEEVAEETEEAVSEEEVDEVEVVDEEEEVPAPKPAAKTKAAPPKAQAKKK